jgi:microcystin-dependent protein
MCMEPYIGEIMMWAGNYAPEGWAYCDGQALSIAQNSPLYALIGTTYGGDGTTRFNLPDLRGRVPVAMGHGPGLTPRVWGEVGGSETAPVNMGGSVQITQAETGQAAAVAAPPSPATVTVPTMPPYLAMSFVIAMTGYWPSRP